MRRKKYELRRGGKVWEVVFEGKPAMFKHEQGADYVAYLLTHPAEGPIHGLILSLRSIPNGARDGGPPAAWASAARNDSELGQHDLNLDDAEAAWALRRNQHQLEGILEDATASETLRHEARLELETIYEFESRYFRRVERTAQRAVRAVRRAIHRLHQNLALARDVRHQPHPVLASLADHLEKHLLIPSARYSGCGSALARRGLAGRFTYEAPPGVVWKCS